MKLWFFLSKGQKPGDILSNLQKGTKMRVPKLPSIPKNINLKLPANINVQSVTSFIQQMVKDIRNHQSRPPGPIGSGGHMKYPYTVGAKIVQFPYKYYYDNNWIFRYYIYAVAFCMPMFWYFSRMSNSKENKAKWKEIRQKEKEEAHHRFDY